MLESIDYEKLLVVAGIVVQDNRVLITKRSNRESSPYFWEFPGGKIERGETPIAALKRELREEVGIKTENHYVYEVLSVHQGARDLYLMFYICRLLPGFVPTCKDVLSWTWAASCELKNYRFLAANRPLIQRLERQGVPDC